MQFTIKTDIGVVRKENQDRAALFEKGPHVFAVLCDGMGGHLGGAEAASIAISVFEKHFRKAALTLDNVSAWFTETLRATIKMMERYASDNKALLDMGTTLTAAVIFKELNKVVIFNIGDSRTYVYNGQLTQITSDQNFRNYYVEHYHYSPDEASQMTGAAALISALGPTKTPSPAAYLVNIDASLRYIILTSDGVHDYIAKPVFERIIGHDEASLATKADQLVSRAINGKSSDNLTVLIVDLQRSDARET